MPLLDNIHLVLVATSHPGNIGATARAMKTMGLRSLRLVTPKIFPHADATARAAGADDILERAEIFATLDDAVADCGLIIGTTARDRYLSWPILEVRPAALQAVSQAVTVRIAILFGNEQSGLTNSDIERCHFMVRIPTAGDYRSLNLGAAAQIVSYELHMAAQDHPACISPHTPAPAVDIERLYTHIEQVLAEIGFLDPSHPRLLRRRIRRLCQRTRPDILEVNILRGILTAIQRGRG